MIDRVELRRIGWSRLFIAGLCVALVVFALFVLKETKATKDSLLTGLVFSGKTFGGTKYVVHLLQCQTYNKSINEQ